MSNMSLSMKTGKPESRYNKMKSLLQQNVAKAALQAFQPREAEDIYARRLLR